MWQLLRVLLRRSPYGCYLEDATDDAASAAAAAAAAGDGTAAAAPDGSSSRSSSSGFGVAAAELWAAAPVDFVLPRPCAVRREESAAAAAAAAVSSPQRAANPGAAVQVGLQGGPAAPDAAAAAAAAAEDGLGPGDILHVCMMPCFDKKLEAARPEFQRPQKQQQQQQQQQQDGADGFCFADSILAFGCCCSQWAEVDLVLATSELPLLLAAAKRSFNSLPAAPLDCLLPGPALGARPAACSSSSSSSCCCCRGQQQFWPAAGATWSFCLRKLPGASSGSSSQQQLLNL
ncbi:iron only hydrogenase large subunit, C-terminal domain-containing protein, putative [Eimeria tenella]|uniref:Iron only hydrogenase large subunit, C-terminal domain-containing protein, putative n=1 Tax=Eimeria tenella TaxID=5802 RepID=U6KQ36_EIMTE|nr:iron only hydrogenase large subunit, C-terminal domain-containing protein, putative [Eimeria tenella]CDJ40242.1 iron only hydrogenase large subunit, C-terminal domain-containing protein, putative [Eimeria tenella]|eukprot:XP_013230995.1 iron only hydrogenase large subunit, C-terminal domain-containing protein, putative [Eimeria tenella]